GHYANIFIVLIFSWIISYSTYATYVRDYLNRSKLEENTRLLTQINNDLITEIHSREKIQEELKRANEKLTLMSALDALTGIPNRRKMTESLNEQWESALVCHHPITLMMIDIDLFKLYNDTYGHLAGDNCLRKVAEVLSDTAGTNNSLIARFGGEEFVFVTSGLDRNEAMELGEKIRVEVEGLNLEHGYSPVGPWVTVSIGVKWLVPTFEDVLSENLTLADQAMYAAKHAGRNRVVMAD
ncbi:MAG: GGDEF domain-containing protein, partial [Ignavibacteriales bacterium]